MLGLREDQPAREPKGKTLPGWALWCSGARTVPAWAPTSLLHSQLLVVLTLTASYGIGRSSTCRIISPH
jgi:hypothetical protein